MSTRLTIAMLHDDPIIVANAIGGDGIIAFPKRGGCKTMVPIRALGSRNNALKLTVGFRFCSDGMSASPAPWKRNLLALFRCRIRRNTASRRAISCQKLND